MEFFRGVNVNWLGWKWYFLAFSMIFSVAGIVKMSWYWTHTGTTVPLSVDFRGGTEVYVQFAEPPRISTRSARRSMRPGSTMRAFRATTTRRTNEVLISLP